LFYKCARGVGLFLACPQGEKNKLHTAARGRGIASPSVISHARTSTDNMNHTRARRHTLCELRAGVDVHMLMLSGGRARDDLAHDTLLAVPPCSMDPSANGIFQHVPRGLPNHSPVRPWGVTPNARTPRAGARAPPRRRSRRRAGGAGTCRGFSSRPSPRAWRARRGGSSSPTRCRTTRRA